MPTIEFIIKQGYTVIFRTYSSQALKHHVEMLDFRGIKYTIIEKNLKNGEEKKIQL